MRPPGHPLVIAHRGASAKVPENTLAAFARAVSDDADGIELDVRITNDDVLVIHHDALVPGLGMIGDLDFAALREHSPEVPTLDEMLSVSGDLLIDVEIKNHRHESTFDPTLRVADHVAAWVSARSLYGRVVVSSIDWETVMRVNELDREIATGPVLVSPTGIIELIDRTAAAGHQWVLPSDVLVGTDPGPAAAHAHDAGLRVGVWTVDDPERLRTLASGGVDAVIANDPAAANEALS